jgi:Tol biopolymer transport system component
VYRWDGATEADERWYRVTVETGESEQIELPAECTGTAWQPGGRWMACEVRHERGETTLTDLVLVDLATNELTQLTDPDDDVANYTPAWSPDGRWLASAAWTADRDPQVVGVYLYEPETGRATRVVDGLISGPAWSPSGEHLTAFDEGSGRIVIFGRDGSGLTSLDHEPRRFVRPTLYPTGGRPEAPLASPWDGQVGTRRPCAKVPLQG